MQSVLAAAFEFPNLPLAVPTVGVPNATVPARARTPDNVAVNKTREVRSLAGAAKSLLGIKFSLIFGGQIILEETAKHVMGVKSI